MAIQLGLGGNISFTITGDGSSTQLDISLDTLGNFLGFTLPTPASDVDLVNFSLFTGAPGITLTPTLINGGTTIRLSFNSAPTNGLNYSVALRLWA